MKEIELKTLFHDLEPTNYKVHFARRSDSGAEPLIDYITDFEYWRGWNTYSKSKNEFNRDYIFSLINFYPEADTWLFGGIWSVFGNMKVQQMAP